MDFEKALKHWSDNYMDPSYDDDCEECKKFREMLNKYDACIYKTWDYDD